MNLTALAANVLRRVALLAIWNDLRVSARAGVQCFHSTWSKPQATSNSPARRARRPRSSPLRSPRTWRQVSAFSARGSDCSHLQSTGWKGRNANAANASVSICAWVRFTGRNSSGDVSKRYRLERRHRRQIPSQFDEFLTSGIYSTSLRNQKSRKIHSGVDFDVR